MTTTKRVRRRHAAPARLGRVPVRPAASVPIRRGSGNVFEDLGFPAVEAAHLLLRTDLMIAVTKRIKKLGLIQRHAASLLGVSQPRVSDLMRFKADRFSVETLVEMLGRLGARVELVVRGRA